MGVSRRNECPSCKIGPGHKYHKLVHLWLLDIYPKMSLVWDGYQKFSKDSPMEVSRRNECPLCKMGVLDTAL